MHAGKIPERPLHVRPQPGQSEALLLVAAEDFLEQPDHGVLIEASGPEVSVLPPTHLELTTVLGGFRFDAELRQAMQSLSALLAIENEERLVTRFEPVFHEG